MKPHSTFIAKIFFFESAMACLPIQLFPCCVVQRSSMPAMNIYMHRTEGFTKADQLLISCAQGLLGKPIKYVVLVPLDCDSWVSVCDVLGLALWCLVFRTFVLQQTGPRLILTSTLMCLWHSAFMMSFSGYKAVSISHRDIKTNVTTIIEHGSMTAWVRHLTGPPSYVKQVRGVLILNKVMLVHLLLRCASKVPQALFFCCCCCNRIY